MILLLAAGASRRMGKTKQLLPWNETSLIEHQLKTLLTTGLKVHVVLGAFAKEIQPQIEDLPITISMNPNWEKGMGNSLAFGVQQIIEKNKHIDGILIALVDQPLLTTAHFKKLINTFTPGQNQIICSKSDEGWSGPPIIFDSFYVNELMQQDGDDGAKNLTKKYTDVVTFVHLGVFMEDADTPEALRELRKY